MNIKPDLDNKVSESISFISGFSNFCGYNFFCNRKIGLTNAHANNLLHFKEIEIIFKIPSKIWPKKKVKSAVLGWTDYINLP